MIANLHAKSARGPVLIRQGNEAEINSWLHVIGLKLVVDLYPDPGFASYTVRRDLEEARGQKDKLAQWFDKYTRHQVTFEVNHEG